MASRLIPKAPQPVHFVDLKKSAGILDDFAVRKNVATKEGTIEHVPTEDNHIVNKKYVDDEIAGIVIPAETDPLSLHLDQTTPQTTVGRFTFPDLTIGTNTIYTSNGKVGFGGIPYAQVQFTTSDDTNPTYVTEWDDRHTFFGQSGSRGGGVGFSNTASTNTENVLFLAPNVAWQNALLAAKTFSFTTDAGETKSLYIASNGNVLIGTSTDTSINGQYSKLQVTGNGIQLTGEDPRYFINATDSSSNPGFVMVNSSGQVGSLFVGGQTGAYYDSVGFYFTTTNFKFLDTYGNALLNLQQGGNLLLGSNLVDDGVNKLQVNGSTWLGDKLSFTQTDGNEYIDSLNDGYMDYGATTAHRFLANVKLTADNRKIIFGTGDDASIYYDGTDLIADCDVVGSGILRHDNAYAEIYCNENSTAQSIPTGTTYTKITAFDTNGNYDNCTADATNDKITVTKAGKYRVTMTASSKSGTAGVTFTTAIFINGTEVTNNHVMRKFLNANDTFSASMTSIESIGANQDVDIRVKHDNGGSVNITPVYLNLNVEYIGE